MGQTQLEDDTFTSAYEQEHQESIYSDQMDHSFSTLVMDGGSSTDDQSFMIEKPDQ